MIQDALGIESDDVANYCFPKDLADRSRRGAHAYIGEWLKTEARYLTCTEPAASAAAVHVDEATESFCINGGIHLNAARREVSAVGLIHFRRLWALIRVSLQCMLLISTSPRGECSIRLKSDGPNVSGKEPTTGPIESVVFE